MQSDLKFIKYFKHFYHEVNRVSLNFKEIVNSDLLIEEVSGLNKSFSIIKDYFLKNNCNESFNENFVNNFIQQVIFLEEPIYKSNFWFSFLLPNSINSHWGDYYTEKGELYKDYLKEKYNSLSHLKMYFDAQNNNL